MRRSARRVQAPPLQARLARRRLRREVGDSSGFLWPGADPANGPALFLDQLSLWDAIILPDRDRRDGGTQFRPAGCEVRRIPPRGSKRLIGDFLGRMHYSAGAGMKGLPFGLYRGDSLLGVAVFSRACRPRWAAEAFTLLPADHRRTATQRRHLTVTEAEYAILSRLALSPDDTDGESLGTGAASWFMCRCLAGLEARNRALWSAQQRLLRGEHLTAEQYRLLAEAAGADRGRGRGYVKAIATWADPYQGSLGRIYQILSFHYAGRTNGSRWTRERVGLRSGRRLSARTIAKASAPSQPGHIGAALRLAWEGGSVRIQVRTGDRSRTYDARWIRAAAARADSTEYEITAALDAAWEGWASRHLAPGSVPTLIWERGSGTRREAFPPKHSYFTGLGSSAWYRRQTEIRYQPLTARLLAEEERAGGRARRDRRRDYYPRSIAAEEIRPDLRSSICELAPPSPGESES